MNAINLYFKSYVHKNRSRTLDFLYILATAVILRIFVSIYSGDSRFYYPDSWDYVVLPSQPGPPRSFHPPTIWHLWNFLTLGNITENNVVGLQMSLGVVTTVLLYFTLRNLCSRVVALVLTTAYMMTPWQYFFERTFLPESLSLFLLILIIWLLNSHWLDQSINIAGKLLAASLILGLLVALKPLFALFGFIVIIGLVIRTVKNTREKRKSTVLTVTSLVSFATPILLLCSVYFSNYGVFSISPGSGSFLITRWSDFISCNSADRTEREIITKAVSEVCQGSPGVIPGDGNSFLWQNTYIGKTLDEINFFEENQKELTRITVEGIFGDKFNFVVTFLKDLTYPLTHLSEPSDLDAYTDNMNWIESDVVKNNFINYSSWFDLEKSKPVQRLGSEKFKDLMSKSLFIPKLLILVFIIIGSIRLFQLRKVYRGKSLPDLARSSYSYFGYSLIIGILYLVLTQFMVNVSSVRNFRYELGQIPIWILLIAVLIKADLNITKLNK